MDTNTTATTFQLLGSAGIGVIIGWHVYYINRYRKADVQLSDLVTLLGILGGGSITALFPAKTDLFGAYGIGLFAGFFAYFFVCSILVRISDNFNVDWFLDGRRKDPVAPYSIPAGTRTTVSAMGTTGTGQGN